HMTEQGRQTAKGNAVLPEGGMAAMMTDVCPHNLRREKVTHATLYGAALQGGIVVRSPEAGRAGQNLKVDTSTAGSAGLKLNTGKTFAQEIQQPVKLTGLRVRRRPTFMPGLDQLAVRVPFHIVNWVFAQQP